MITTTKLVNAVRRLVKASPKNVYINDPFGRNCCYTKGNCTDGSVGCLIGQALLAIGANKGTLRRIDNQGSASAQELIKRMTRNQKSTPRKDQQIYWLRRVQIAQDKGYTWGDVLEFADSETQLETLRRQEA